MDNPASHCYQVTLSCQGVDGVTCDFKMPVWSSGYYLPVEKLKGNQLINAFPAI
jgi:predicted metalloprotease with PDZ domain